MQCLCICVYMCTHTHTHKHLFREIRRSHRRLWGTHCPASSDHGIPLAFTSQSLQSPDSPFSPRVHGGCSPAATKHPRLGGRPWGLPLEGLELVQPVFLSISTLPLWVHLTQVREAWSGPRREGCRVPRPPCPARVHAATSSIRRDVQRV